VIDTVRAGKDVYCEKPMSHSIADGAEMVKAVQASGRILQVGSQVVTSPLFLKAKEMIAAGDIGKVSLVELTMGRNDPNGAWQYPLPAGLSEDNVDWTTWLGDTPKRPLDPVVFARWRSWRAYGSGVAGDLMVHLLSGMQCALGLSAIPDRALSSGGLIRYKDGREVPDLHLVLLEYGDLIVSVRVTLNTETPSVSRFMGSHGMIEIGSRLTWTPQLGIDLKPSYYDGGFPSAMRDAYEKQWHAENDAKIQKLPAFENTEIFESVSSMDGTRHHLQNFFTAVQNRTPVEEDVLFGHHAAAACHMTNQSYYTRQAVTRETAV
jgi:predicted dehydrogenase